MEEKFLKEEESLRLIARMISENRARLSNRNSDILWMTGVASVLICVGMLVLRKYLPDSQVMWFTFLIPVSAWLIDFRYRERRVKTFLDEMFHAAWMYTWLFPALLSGIYLFSYDGNYGVSDISGLLVRRTCHHTGGAVEAALRVFLSDRRLFDGLPLCDLDGRFDRVWNPFFHAVLSGCFGAGRVCHAMAGKTSYQESGYPVRWQRR